MAVTPSQLLRAHLALLLCALIYSGWNVVAARCLAVISPITFSLIRELASIVVLYTWAHCVEGPLSVPSPRDRLRFVALGAVLAAFQLCFAVGVALAGAQMAALFQCIEPSTAAAIGALVGAEPPTRAKALSALLAGGGVLIMQLGGETAAHDGDGSAPSAMQTTVGSILLLLQGAGISCYCLLQKALVRGAPAEPLTPPPPSPPQPPEPALSARAEDAGSPEASEAGSLAGAGASSLAAAEGGALAGRDMKQRLLPEASRGGRAHGAVTVTAHAYCSSLLVMVVAALLDAAFKLEEPSPLSHAQMARLATPLSAAAVAYAVLLASVVGYSLRAWANRHVDAGVLVLYNAVQPPLTALLLLAVSPGDARYGWRELLGSALVMGAVALSALDARRSRRLGRDS